MSGFDNILSAIGDDPVRPDLGPLQAPEDAASAQEQRLNVLVREALYREANARAEKAEHEVLRLQSLHEMRRKYMGRTFWFVSLFTLFSCAFLLAAAIHAECPRLPTVMVSDAVLITLLTTTLGTVFGVLFIAFKWLFPAVPPPDAG